MAKASRKMEIMFLLSLKLSEGIFWRFGKDRKIAKIKHAPEAYQRNRV